MWTSVAKQYLNALFRRKLTCWNVDPSPPIDNVWILVIVWRLGGNVIRNAMCCFVYDSCAQWYAHSWTFFKFACWFRFRFFCVFLHYTCFCVSLYCFVHLLLAFVVSGFVSSVPSQEIGWDEHPRNDLFCV